MGLMNMFSKKKDNNKVEQQVVEDYYTPVVEPVGELPVSNGEHISKFMDNPIDINNTSTVQNSIIFEDEKPSQILTTEQKELADNGFYLTMPSYPEPTVNPTTSLNPIDGLYQDTSNDDSYSALDDELPYNDDEEDVFNNSIDGSYGSAASQTYDDNKVNEHKFFSTSVDEIDNYKNQLGQNGKDKTKIIGDSSIFNIGRIDDNR